jgi:hypothetical protein
MRESVDTNRHPTSRRPGPPIPTQHNHNSIICNPTQSPSPAAPQRPTDPAHPGQPKTTTTQLFAIPSNPLHQTPTTHWIPKVSELQSYIWTSELWARGFREVNGFRPRNSQITPFIQTHGAQLLALRACSPKSGNQFRKFEINIDGKVHKFRNG